MTPTPEHIKPFDLADAALYERLALANPSTATVETSYHARLACFACKATKSGESKRFQEEALRTLSLIAYKEGWRVTDDERALCPDCAADATEGESG